jgi:NAD(P) transhydrogenase subunit alpha
VVFATVNVVGGYMVTNRMLAMFKKKDTTPKAGDQAGGRS